MAQRDIRRLAVAGLAAVGLRQLGIRGIGLVGTVALTRLLTPHDFGAVAIGAAVVNVLGFASDAGIGAALIRGREVPTREKLETVLGLQLAFAGIVVALVVGLASRYGDLAKITALIVASLPFGAYRAPGAILLERELRYRPLALIELLETLIYYGWAIAIAHAGFGVWGLASASPVRSAVGATIMITASPIRVLIPRVSFGRAVALLRFGIQYQSVSVFALIRDQGLNFGTAAIAGVSTLGLWTLSYRMLQLPFLLYETVWRVSYPTMARLLDAGEPPVRLVERGLAITSVATGAMLSVLVASTPAFIPSVFGASWSGAGTVIPWAACGLMFGGPISAATVGYLYAIGDGRTVMLATALDASIWLLLALALLRPIGVQAIGVGWFVGAIAETIVLATRTKRVIPISILPHLAVPAGLFAISGAVGWAIANRLPPSIQAAAAAAAVSLFVYMVGTALLRRRLLMDTLGLLPRSLAALAE